MDLLVVLVVLVALACVPMFPLSYKVLAHTLTFRMTGEPWINTKILASAGAVFPALSWFSLFVRPRCEWMCFFKMKTSCRDVGRSYYIVDKRRLVVWRCLSILRTPPYFEPPTDFYLPFKLITDRCLKYICIFSSWLA